MEAFFELLTDDHDEVKGLLEKMEDTSDGAVKTREKLLVQLKEALVPHMKAEEKAFYPALMKKKEVKKETLEALEEHHLAETVLRQLEDVSAGDDVWGAKLAVLKELVEHHIEEEEDELFEMAEEALGEDQLESIMQEFQKEKEKVKKQIS